VHEPFDPHCSHCRKFVYCFSRDGPLAEWGYCEDELANGPPPDEQLRWLEAAAAQGNHALLFSARLPVYQETDDGCARFVPR
jgi:hypothetical protein